VFLQVLLICETSLLCKEVRLAAGLARQIWALRSRLEKQLTDPARSPLRGSPRSWFWFPWSGRMGRLACALARGAGVGWTSGQGSI